MSVSSRSIMEGLAIGKALGHPIGEALSESNQRDFEKQQQQLKFQQQVQLLAAQDPNLALAMQQGAPAPEVTGLGEISNPASASIGDSTYDPNALKSLNAADAEAKLKRDIQLHQSIARSIYGAPVADAQGNMWQPDRVHGGAIPFQAAGAQVQGTVKPAPGSMPSFGQPFQDHEGNLWQKDRTGKVIPVQIPGAAEAPNSTPPTDDAAAPLPTQLKGAPKGAGGGDAKVWDSFIKQVNPLTASSRNALGAATIASSRANRALVALDNPMVSNADLGNITADIAGIYKGGSPDQLGMSENSYNTLQSKLASIQQFLTGKPADAAPQAVKDRLKVVLHELNGSNNQIIQQQLRIMEKSHSGLVSAHQDDWDALKEELVGGIAGGPASAQAQPTAAPAVGKKVGGFTILKVH